MAFEKIYAAMAVMNKERMNRLAWVWNITKAYHGRIVCCILIDLLAIAFALLTIYGSKQAIDIAVGTLSGELWNYGILILCSLMCSIVASSVSSWLKGCIRLQLRKRIQNLLASVLMLSSWKATGKWHTGDLMMRLETDCAEVVQMVVTTVPLFIVTSVKLCASLVFLWVMDPLLTGMILAVSPLFLLSKFYYRNMRKLNQEVKQADSDFGTILQENLRQRLLIRSLEAIDYRNSKMISCQETRNELEKRLLRFSMFTGGVVSLTFGAGYLIAFLWGIYRLSVGDISFGTLTVFVQLVGRIQSPILSSIGFLPSTVRFRTSVERLTELYESESEQIVVDQQLAGTKLSLKICDISFRYEESKVIDHFTAEFHPGMATAIVGPTGRGKTTLIRLILALIPPESGQLLLCDEKMDYPVSIATRVHFAYVPQGNTLFSGSIRENLLIACPKASEMQMKNALRIACADFVESLPQGLDTWIGENGYGLSEGQAQRVAIARAILRDSSIWIFDEITSALDPNTAQCLIRNLLEIGKEKTLLFVTHDRILTEACSQVVKLH